MIENVPPVYAEQSADDFKPMQSFNSEQEAIEFKKQNGGLIVKDTLKEGRWFVIRIPKSSALPTS